MQAKDITDMTNITHPVPAVCNIMILMMILFWEWKFKIKKFDYNDKETLVKIYN